MKLAVVLLLLFWLAFVGWCWVAIAGHADDVAMDEYRREVEAFEAMFE